MRFPELGIYLLPGHTDAPADILDEARAAEALGLGSAWVSERFDVKEVGALCGAALAVTREIWIGTGVTNVNTRHPLVLASLATTLSRLSHGRFALGIGRGIGVRSGMMGLPPVKNADLVAFAGLMRKLWRGEPVMGHDSALGKFPFLHQASWLEEPIPLLMTAFGERALAFAGSVFDGVILHTFMSDEAVARAVGLVRRGAEEAGRDPASVMVWSVLAVACDAGEERLLRLLTARMATYLQIPGYGELLFRINGWDAQGLADFRSHGVVKAMRGAIDAVASLDQLREIRALMPATWLPAAIGSPEACARRIADQLAAGADGVILHASLPHEAAPAVEAYAKIRNGDRLRGRTGRPAAALSAP
jgi:5,10-methylenetetrahydromethanopterin reductase